MAEEQRSVPQGKSGFKFAGHVASAKPVLAAFAMNLRANRAARFL